MNLKKIIQEEINSFDWAEDIVDIYVGLRYRLTGNPMIYTVSHFGNWGTFTSIDEDGEEWTVKMDTWEYWKSIDILNIVP